MEQTFTRTELVAFGHYLMSKERENRIASVYLGLDGDGVDFNERLRQVYHADVENFIDKQAAVVS